MANVVNVQLIQLARAKSVLATLIQHATQAGAMLQQANAQHVPVVKGQQEALTEAQIEAQIEAMVSKPLDAHVNLFNVQLRNVAYAN